MIDLASSADSSTRALLRQHPRVKQVAEGSSSGIEFQIGDWTRSIRIGDPKTSIYGLVEIEDNNPMVCADSISVPSPGATLASISIAPLALAGLVTEAPVMVFNVPVDEHELEGCGTRLGITEGINFHCESYEADRVGIVSTMVALDSAIDFQEVRTLYAERYGRSFNVRESMGEKWDIDLVKGTSIAKYRLSLAADEPLSLLTIRVMADLNGKCGAAQVVHAMNVMCGFEESLGIA